MGNNDCQKCLSAEREMFAEILLGKNKNDNYTNNIIDNNIHNNIKQISDEMPQEIL